MSSRDDAVSVKRGRPPDRDFKRKVLDAALGIYAERGWSAFNFNAVAERAGVGKPGMYRRWDSRIDLLLEAFKTATPGLEEFVPQGLREDLLSIAMNYATVLKGPRGLASHRMLLDHPDNPEVFDLVADSISNPRLALLETALKAAVQRGEIASDADLAPIGDILLGGVFFAVVRSRDSTVSSDRISDMVGGVLRALGYTNPHGGR